MGVHTTTANQILGLLLPGLGVAHPPARSLSWARLSGSSVAARWRQRPSALPQARAAHLVAAVGVECREVEGVGAVGGIVKRLGPAGMGHHQLAALVGARQVQHQRGCGQAASGQAGGGAAACQKQGVPAYGRPNSAHASSGV